MNVFSKLFNSFLLLLERIKGNTTVVEIKTPKNLVGHLTGYSIHGYEIQIFCQKRHYRRSYDKWYIPNDNHVAYRVFSIVTNDAPNKLKKACELDIVIPELMSENIDERRQRQAAIDAYLDILAQSLVSVPVGEVGGEYSDKNTESLTESMDELANRQKLVEIFARSKEQNGA